MKSAKPTGWLIFRERDVERFATKREAMARARSLRADHIDFAGPFLANGPDAGLYVRMALR